MRRSDIGTVPLTHPLCDIGTVPLTHLLYVVCVRRTVPLTHLERRKKCG